MNAIPFPCGARSTAFIQVGAGGACVDLLVPEFRGVTATDLAVTLGRLPRFAGNTREFYSVAQHMVWCVRAAQRLGLMLPAQRYLALHDAHEAVTGDIPTPLKRLMGPKMAQLEERLQAALHLHFGLPWPAPVTIDLWVRRIDTAALATERRDLMPAPARPWGGPAPLDDTPRIEPEHAAQAAARWLGTLRELGLEARR